MRIEIFPYLKTHFFDKRAVKKVKRALVIVAVHVVHVCVQTPVDRFRPELNLPEFFEEVIQRPFAICWPFLNWLCQNEWLVGPASGELRRGKI